MRRQEKEITDIAEIRAIVRKAQICRIGLAHNNVPYVVPVSFGYDGRSLWFHCAREGRKLDMMRANNRVCFEIDINAEMLKKPEACQWGFHYRSVIGYGTAHIIDALEEKREGFSIIMKQYSDQPFEFSESALAKTLVVRIDIEEMTGKKSG